MDANMNVDPRRMLCLEMVVKGTGLAMRWVGVGGAEGMAVHGGRTPVKRSSFP